MVFFAFNGILYRQFLMLQQSLDAIVITILSKSSPENHLRNCLGQFILRVQVVVDFIIHWIIRLVAHFPIGGILTRNHRFGLRAKLEMLMLDDTSVWRFAVRVVTTAFPLIVLHVHDFCFKRANGILMCLVHNRRTHQSFP